MIIVRAGSSKKVSAVDEQYWYLRKRKNTRLVDFSVFIAFYIIDRILSPIAYVHNGDNYNGRDIDSHLLLTCIV